MSISFGNSIDYEILQRAQLGRVFVACTGIVASPVVAGTWRGLFTVPANHTRRVFLYRIDVSTNLSSASNDVMRYVELVVNPTINLPAVGQTNASPPSPVICPAYNVNFGSSVTSPVTLSWQFRTIAATRLEGGTATSLAFPAGVNKNLMTFQLPPLILPPGITIGFNADYAQTNGGSMFAYWWEDE